MRQNKTDILSLKASDRFFSCSQVLLGNTYQEALARCLLNLIAVDILEARASCTAFPSDTWERKRLGDGRQLGINYYFTC
jgi:hypothetical protein